MNSKPFIERSRLELHKLLRRMLSEINYSYIALVPKVPNPSTVSDFRPISCCNLIYKCIHKLIANKLSLALPSIINPAQTAFIKGRQITDNIILAYELLNGFWRKLLKQKDMARGVIRHRIGAGTDTMMWIEFWLPNGPICDQLGLSEMDILQLDTSVKVDSLISNSQWTIPAALQFFPFLLSESFTTQLQSLPLPSLVPDSTEWLPSLPLGFSHKLTLEYFCPPSLSFAWHKLVWFKHCIPKHSHIFWLAVREKFCTLDTKPIMLHKHYTNVSYLCPSNWESIDHLFFKCKFSRAIWDFIQNVARFYIRPDYWKELIPWCSSHWSNEGYTIHKLMLSAAVYYIWLERNARAFRNKASNAPHTINLIKSCIRARIVSLVLKSGVELKQKGTTEDLQKMFLDGCTFTGCHTWILPD
ncbi:uncharacterized protein LOC132277252 [Cornus florida]|uniref:uncharacterized protein LOC132277252 n=1 Tax=Cornus florida TaxID=4283 RepID=UPI00289864FF|nr:uncharacterized protein LOC132277252 [Cornus florida]